MSLMDSKRNKGGGMKSVRENAMMTLTDQKELWKPWKMKMMGHWCRHPLRLKVIRGASPAAPVKKKVTTITVKTEKGEEAKKQVTTAPKKAGMTQEEFDKANGLIYADIVAVLDIEILKLLVDVTEGDGQQAWIALPQHFENRMRNQQREKQHLNSSTSNRRAKKR